MFARSARIARSWILIGWGLLGALAHGQTIYRIVGPDGKLTFSDKPPATETSKATTASPGARTGGGATNLPFELRQVVGRYPVTLYSAPDCAPCATGRSLLQRRGIPFAEKTVTTADDAAALQRLMGDTSLPILTVGAQRLKGLSDAEWNQTLDAAGYPATSALPASYRHPAASPLVAVQAAPSAPDERPAAPTKTPDYVPPPVGPTPTNPAGITF